MRDEEGKVQNSDLLQRRAAMGFLGNQEFVKVKALGQNSLLVISHL